MLDFNRMGLTIGQRQSRSQRAFTNSPIRSMSAHKSVSCAMKILTRSVDRIMTIPALRSPSRAKEIQDGPHGRQENREEGRDQHDAARSTFLAASRSVGLVSTFFSIFLAAMRAILDLLVSPGGSQGRDRHHLCDRPSQHFHITAIG